MSTSEAGLAFYLPKHFAIVGDMFLLPLTNTDDYVLVGTLTCVTFHLNRGKLSLLSFDVDDKVYQFWVGGPHSEIADEHIPTLRELYRALPRHMRVVD